MNTEVLKKAFKERKFRQYKDISIFCNISYDMIDISIYYKGIELIALTDILLCDNTKGYMVYINAPYWESCASGWNVRGNKIDKQNVFLETHSFAVALNAIERTIKNKRYPHIKLCW